MAGVASNQKPCSDPVFILSSARSGSTLLRFLLDAHPDMACPPETKLPWLCAQLAETYSVLEGVSPPRAGPGLWTVADPVVARLRENMDLIMNSYLARRGKKRYCDKNLGSAPWAGLLLRVYPRAKFLCLYRHPMDMIHSGLEACPWGLNGYGFDSYAASSPGNMVTALGRYWADYTSTILTVEENFPDRCYRIRYEDLVAEPEIVASAIFGFLDAAAVPGITSRCFSQDRERFGPADYKIWNTSRITRESIGKGWSVPVNLMPLPLQERIGKLTSRLGYIAVDERWGTADPPTDVRLHANAGSIAVNQLAIQRSCGPGVPPAGVRLTADRIRAGLSRLDESFRRLWHPWSSGSVLLAISVPAPSRGRIWWCLDLAAGTVVAGSGDHSEKTDWTILGSADTWERVLRGQTNLGVAFRRGELRYQDKGDAGPGSAGADIRVAMLADLLGITRWEPGQASVVSAQASADCPARRPHVGRGKPQVEIQVGPQGERGDPSPAPCPGSNSEIAPSKQLA
jgi:hypothetical protein